MLWRLLLVPSLMLFHSASASAQQVGPPGPFVIDARGTLARFHEDPAVAGALDVSEENLPTRGLGLTVGAHWYPVRRRGITLGLGCEMLFARDSRTLDVLEGSEATAPTVTTRFSALAPQVSLNFGNRDGWSYLSAGYGLATLTAERADAPFTDDAARTGTLHYGGGARWFARPRLAFTFDVRFYTVNATDAAGDRPAFPRSRMMVISAGISAR
jgi:hypothetical protein